MFYSSSPYCFNGRRDIQPPIDWLLPTGPLLKKSKCSINHICFFHFKTILIIYLCKRLSSCLGARTLLTFLWVAFTDASRVAFTSHDELATRN